MSPTGPRKRPLRSPQRPANAAGDRNTPGDQNLRRPPSTHTQPVRWTGGSSEIVVSDVVRQLVAGKGFVFVERGSVDLKGFEEPVRLCSVQWDA